MSRLDIKTQNRAQTVVDNLYRDVERRIAASPPGLCPVDMSLAFLKLCHAQSCGKCVPCRIGRRGIEEIVVLDLTQQEQQQLDASCQVIRKHIALADSL